MGMSGFTTPRPLSLSDRLGGFRCGVAVVDHWVAAHAQKAMKNNTAVVYISFCEGRAAGIYSLSAHSVYRDDVQGGWLKRNTPEQIPVTLLGMLGVDACFQGQGLGSSLLRDAIARSRHAAEEVGSRALLVDPADERARLFYARFGFRPLLGTGRMYVPLR